MAKKTDLKSVQAALDRAAIKSVGGDRDARSGQFITSKSAKTSPRTVAASALSQTTKRK
jgi:hypothetical protein